MYCMKIQFFHHAWRSHPEPVTETIEGETIKELMASYRAFTMNHDLARFTEARIFDMWNTEEDN